MQAITQAAMKTRRAVVKAVTEIADLAEGNTRKNWADNVGPLSGGPLISKNQYIELRNFGMEVKDIFMTKSYDIGDAEKVPTTKKCS